MQKYTTKQLLEILEDENFDYKFHDCLVGHPNKELAKICLKELDDIYNLVITTEDEAPINKIINTLVRTYHDPVTRDMQDRMTRKFEIFGNTKPTYKDYTVKDIRDLIEEMKEKFSTECYNNIIRFLNKITKDKDENFYMEYATQRLNHEDTKLHMINDFTNKYLERYYSWLTYGKDWHFEEDVGELADRFDRKGVDEGKYDVEEFKNEFEIYLLV